jgi:leucyl aminopeptidase (aminopeptidase T)
VRSAAEPGPPYVAPTAPPTVAAESPSPERLQLLARSILTKNLGVKPGESVTIEAWPHTLPYAVALARETRRLRAHPLIHFEDEAAYWDSVDSGEAKLLGASPAHEWAALAKTDVYIHMWGPGDRVRLNRLPEKKASELFRWNGGWYSTAQKAGVRGVRLELGRPYPSLADAYGADESEWTDALAEATLVDPAALARTAEPLLRALRTGRKVRITHDNGTDLSLGLAGREPRLFNGRFAKGDLKRPFGNMMTLPAGAIRVALDEREADGTLVGNRTDYFDDGIATDVVFEFSKGKLRSARFGRGKERFQTGYRSGGKGRDRPGMLGIGLNPKLHNTPQVEDLEAGAVMVSVGGNRNLGGTNASPFFGWGIVAGATVEVDGRRLALPG